LRFRFYRERKKTKTTTKTGRLVLCRKQALLIVAILRSLCRTTECRRRWYMGDVRSLTNHAVGRMFPEVSKDRWVFVLKFWQWIASQKN